MQVSGAQDNSQWLEQCSSICKPHSKSLVMLWAWTNSVFAMKAAKEFFVNCTWGSSLFPVSVQPSQHTEPQTSPQVYHRSESASPSLKVNATYYTFILSCLWNMYSHVTTSILKLLLTAQKSSMSILPFNLAPHPNSILLALNPTQRRDGEG